jgi:two-component system phosphate regulon sensor histidine kinase PhoR
MTLRHLGIAVVVLLLINAQLSWWIVYTIGQARERLELERSLLVERARSWSVLSEPRPTLPEGLEVVAASLADSTTPMLDLGDGTVVRPTNGAWSEILEDYRRRIVMMVSEGSFFALLLLVGLGLMWRTLRREVELEKQHRNFMSAITHELKSPLASMRLSLETVLRGRADQSASVRFLENALQDTERLQSLVQKVLEVTRYARIGSGLDLQPGDLVECVEDAVETFSRRATAAGVGLELDLEPELWANHDPEAFQIVVSNLLENALKYGGAMPRVAVRLVRRGSDAVLEVRDNGHGVHRDEVDLVFNRFWRSGDEMTRTTQGTGLGLYLVRQIVTGHGGRVRVADTGPEGTTFEVAIPAMVGEGA